MRANAFSCFLATITAPGATGLLFALGTKVSSYDQEWASFIFSKLGLFFVGYLIALFFVLLIGLPIFLFALSKGMANLWSSMLTGIMVGAAFSLIIRAPSSPQLNDFLVLTGNGISVSAIFWLVYSFTTSKLNK